MNGNVVLQYDTNLVGSLSAGATNAWGTFYSKVAASGYWTNFLTGAFITTNLSGSVLMETNGPTSVLYSETGGGIYNPTGTWVQVAGTLPVPQTFFGYDRYAPGESLV